MFLEYDWVSDAYRARLGDAFPSIKRSFETLAAARHALRLVGLRLGVKTDPRTWRVQPMVADDGAGAPLPRSGELTSRKGRHIISLEFPQSARV